VIVIVESNEDVASGVLEARLDAVVIAVSVIMELAEIDILPESLNLDEPDEL